MKKLVTTVAVLGALALAGCSSVGVTQLHSAAAKPAGCNVDIYASASEINHKYQTVCLLDSRTGSTLFHTRTAAAAIDHAKSEACECGADAMLIETADTEGMSFSRWGQGKAIIRAIKYTD